MIAVTPEECEWYTPPEILELVYKVMSIDLDPASPWPETVLARKHYTKEMDGLRLPWRGRIFLNPPYGRSISKWVDKFDSEWRIGNVRDAILLVPAKTDTKWFGKLAKLSSGICCWEGRIRFISPLGVKGTGTFASLFILCSEDRSLQNRFFEVFSEGGSMWAPRPQNPAGDLE